MYVSAGLAARSSPTVVLDCGARSAVDLLLDVVPSGLRRAERVRVALLMEALLEHRETHW
jgi:hypothetical protein